MKTSVYFTAIGSLISAVAISLNALGIYLLRANKPLNNSKLLLINLASSEILNSVLLVINSYVLRFFSDEDKMLIVRKITTGGYVYYFAMYLLTVDRLLATLNPMKYRISVTKKRLTRIILATWVLALVIAISLIISNAWFILFQT